MLRSPRLALLLIVALLCAGVAPAPSTYAAPTADGSPYGGTPWAVPGTIQFEDFNTGGEGVAYHDTSAGNDGGMYRTSENVDIGGIPGITNVGGTQPGEWLKYTVEVSTSASYSVTVRVASPATGAQLHIEVDGVNVTGSIAVPNTGSWDTYTTVSAGVVDLTSGAHVVRVVFDANNTHGAAGNYDWLSFQQTKTQVHVVKTGTGSGAVHSLPPGINCGTTCSAGFNNGSLVLAPFADAGSAFVGWSGGWCIGVINCSRSLSEPRTVTATFVAQPVQVGDQHVCRITGSGVECWGSNASGQAPSALSGTVINLEAGGAHTCGISSTTGYTGDVICWGSNTKGQTNTPNYGGMAQQVSAGWEHTCALRQTGELTCWGDNSEGQRVSLSGPYVQVSAGGFHTCALDGDGALSCWGDNDARPASASGTFTQVSTGWQHTCAINAARDVQCWGFGPTAAPSSVAGPFTQIAAGGSHTCALQADGDLQCWGSNLVGQAPALVSGPFVHLSVSGSVTCANRQDGLAQCWGLNASGQSPQPTLSPATLPDAAIGQSYNQALTLSDGWAPYTATLTSGALPDGMTLSSAGQISGTPNVSGSYTFTVRMVEARTFFAERTYTLVVLPHQRPVAHAGQDATLLTGMLGQLDGSNSSAAAGFGQLSYRWQQTGGSAVTLSNPAGEQPTFSAPLTPGALTFTLAVTDSDGHASSSTDSVIVTVVALSASNSGPALSGEPVSFSATQTDSPLSYSWSFGDGATGSGATVQHTYAAAGTYTATVTANDGFASSTATTRVVVKDAAPGGIFDDLTLWLRADAGIASPTQGGTVTSWQDQSPTSAHLAQGSASNAPTYSASAWNGNPVLTFDATDYLTRTIVGSELFSATDATIIFAQQSRGGSTWFTWQTGSSNQVSFDYSGNGSAMFRHPSAGVGQIQGTSAINGTPHLVTGRRAYSTQWMFVDGWQNSVSSGNTASLDITQSATLALGKLADGSLGWNGDIAEVLVFKRSLSATELTQAQSYLALKYGLTLGFTFSPVSYTDSQGAEIWTGSSTYQRNVAGIGRDDLSTLNQRRSASSVSGDILTVAHGTLATPTALPADRTFLIWGRNSSSITSTASYTSGGFSYTRMARTWRVQRTGTLGTVSLAFDMSSVPNATYNAGDLALLIDDDGDFSNATVHTAGRSLTNSTLSFSVESLPQTAYIAIRLSGPQTLTVTKHGSGSGTITSSPAGISCGSSCTASFNSGTAVTLTVTPAVGTSFSGWSGACSGSATTCTLTMTTGLTATAQLFLDDYELSLSVQGNGTVSSAQGSLSCTATGGVCTSDIPHGTVVTLAATPDAGWQFAGWSGDTDCADTSTTCAFTMTGERSITATFEPALYTLTVEKLGDGASIGTITSTPAGISCGVTCTASFEANTVVTLTASHGPYSTFIRWEGACAAFGGPTCVVTMSQARSASATFHLYRYGFTLEKRGSGTGTVTGSPGGFSCRTTCTATFPHGTVVTMTAVADTGSYFAGWSAAGCPQEDQLAPTCVYTMTTSYAVDAIFSPITPTLTVASVGMWGGSGVVTSEPAGISCGSTCTHTFDPNATVTLTATPNVGSSFGGWDGACAAFSGITCTVTMSQGHDVWAYFIESQHTLDLTVVGSGTITDTYGVFDCTEAGGDCSLGIPEGIVITLSATPADGWYFAGWSGDTDCDDSETICFVPMTQARAITATFTDEPPQTGSRVFLPLLRQ